MDPATTTTTVSKRCSRCRQEKALGDYGRDGSRKDGLNHRCKECHRARTTAYRAANLEKVREKDRARAATFRAKYPEKVRARNAAHHAKNRETILGRKATYRRAKRTQGCPEFLAARNAANSRREATKRCCTPLCLMADPTISDRYTEAGWLSEDWGETHVDHRLPLGRLPDGVTWTTIKAWAKEHHLDHLPIAIRVRRYLSATDQSIQGVAGWLRDDQGRRYWTDGVVGLHVAANLRPMPSTANVSKSNTLEPDLCGMVAGLLEDGVDQAPELPIDDDVVAKAFLDAAD